MHGEAGLRASICSEMEFSLVSRLTARPQTYIWKSADSPIGREFFLDVVSDTQLYLPITRLAIALNDRHSPLVNDELFRGLDYSARLAMLQTGKEEPVNGYDSYHLVEAYLIRDRYLIGYSSFGFAPSLQEFQRAMDLGSRDRLLRVAQFKEQARRIMEHTNSPFPRLLSYSKLVNLIRNSNLPDSHKNAVKALTRYTLT